jgi:hypothetical protein
MVLKDSLTGMAINVTLKAIRNMVLKKMTIILEASTMLMVGRPTIEIHSLIKQTGV